MAVRVDLTVRIHDAAFISAEAVRVHDAACIAAVRPDLSQPGLEPSHQMGGGSRPVQSEAEKEGKKNGSGGVRHDVHLMGDPPAGHHGRAGTVVEKGGTAGPWREPAGAWYPEGNSRQEAFGPVVCR